MPAPDGDLASLQAETVSSRAPDGELVTKPSANKQDSAPHGDRSPEFTDPVSYPQPGSEGGKQIVRREAGRPRCVVCNKMHKPPHIDSIQEANRANEAAREAKNDKRAAARQTEQADKPADKQAEKQAEPANKLAYKQARKQAEPADKQVCKRAEKQAEPAEASKSTFRGQKRPHEDEPKGPSPKKSRPSATLCETCRKYHVALCMAIYCPRCKGYHMETSVCPAVTLAMINH